jgi:subtilisin family serine protease
MRRGSWVVVVALLLVATGFRLGAGLTAGPGAWAAPPQPANSASVDGTKPVRTAEVAESERWVVEFEARADVSGATRLDDKRARGRYVRDRLVATASRSQGPALDLVEDTAGASAQSYWLRNVLVVDGDADLAAELAQLDGVREVRPERIFPLVDPVPLEEAIEVAAGDPAWGVGRIGAPAAWEQGVVGAGIVVANIDTGVDVTHPALVEQYRGNLGAGGFVHDYNWWDPTGICGSEPCDNAGHGTHTMGTIVGGDGLGPFEPDIGVAPGARWIAAKGCEDFWCSEEALLSSGQFVLAPTALDGTAPDPGRAPHIVSNSWGGGPGDPFYLDVVQAWRAAGIIPVFSSGNPGPACREGGSPADYLDAVSVGATDADDEIAEFSGRGPSAYGKINPDVTAPGVDVTSSLPGGGYEAWSGTSMAAPHVAGTFALMLSAEPDLIGDIGTTVDLLRETAVGIEDLSCGGSDDGVPNNVYGYGRIDAATAVDLVASGGTLSGTITAADTGQPIGGARVTAAGESRSATTVTRADGTFRLLLQPGPYAVSATAFGYATGLAGAVTIETDQTTVVDLALTPLPRYAVSGRVLTAENGEAIAGATVRAVGTPLDPVVSDRRGNYRIVLPVGTHLLEAAKGGCMQRSTVEVEVVAATTVDLPLARKLDRYGHGCELIRYQPARNVRDQTALYGDDSYGRLRLPFTFPFYGERYGAVFVDTNGYLSFLDPGWSEFFSTPIPNRGSPDAAVYALWQDLVVDEDTEVAYRLTGGAAVIDYRGVRTLEGDARVDLQVQLKRDGAIEVHYGTGTTAAGGGSRATIGLEDHTGTDALMVGYREQLLTDRTAIRYTRVATSAIRGRVTDANDGLPIVGATVRATPGGQWGRTDADGRYELRVLAGSYTVEATSEGYVPASQAVTVRRDRTVTADLVLRAPRAEVSPSELVATTPLGAAVTETVTVANTGSAPLTFEVRERDLGVEPPDLPPVEPTRRLVRPPDWRRPAVPDGVIPQLVGEVDLEEELEIIIEDPAGDAIGPVDVIAVRGGMDEFELGLGFDFTADTPMDELIGFFYLDVDQDPSTGLPPDALDGKPAQDIGVDYFVNLELPWDEAWVVSTTTFEVVAVVPVAVDGSSVRVDVPLAALTMGPEILGVDVATVVGDWMRPTDWAPDAGHGTVEPFRDAPWMAADPSAGELEPGQAQELVVTLGGEGVAAGSYTGELMVRTNAPRQRDHRVAVSLEVTLAEGFGLLTGTVTDAFSGAAVVGAAVELDASDAEPPYRTSVLTGEDGTYLLAAPEGTWPVTFTSPDHLALTADATVVAGRTARLDVELDPELPRAELEGGPLAFTVAVGDSDAALLLLRNTGYADLLFQVLEREVTPEPAPERTPTLAEGLTSRQGPSEHTPEEVAPSAGDAAVLVIMDALPWESEALLEVFASNGIAPDVVGSAQLGALDLDPYDVIVLANDQPPAFYAAYGEHLDELEAFVTEGGYLWVGAASYGWNGGGFDGRPLPGGVSVLEQVFEEANHVLLPDHPAMLGVPERFIGSAASHSAFEDLLPGTAVIAVGEWEELPTMVEYPLGAGTVLATGQTLDFAYDAGEDGGTILTNLVPYVAAWMKVSDVPWLTADPADGIVASGDERSIEVAVDATDLGPGEYEARLIVVTNDPYLPRVLVTVSLEVTTER